jgi:hypothetical protein
MAIISKHLFQYSLIFTVAQIQLPRGTGIKRVISSKHGHSYEKSPQRWAFYWGRERL